MHHGYYARILNYCSVCSHACQVFDIPKNTGGPRGGAVTRPTKRKTRPAIPPAPGPRAVRLRSLAAPANDDLLRGLAIDAQTVARVVAFFRSETRRRQCPHPPDRLTNIAGEWGARHCTACGGAVPVECRGPIPMAQ